MLITEAEEELKKILLSGGKTVPILFLGAGFSIGAQNKSSLLDGSGLKELILNRLIAGKVPNHEYEEMKEYNLRDLCNEVYTLYKGKDELYNLLIECFSKTYPKEHGFHYKLTDYPWKKIYTVNIDDLIENIYDSCDKKLLVQYKDELCNEDDAETILYKLHGCVRHPENGFVFSRDEYLEMTTKMLDAKVSNFVDDMLNSNIIFVGTNLDEPDIEHFLKIYCDSGMKRKTNKLIFINKSPGRKLKSKIEQVNGVLIDASAEDFFKYISKLNYNPSELKKSLISLNYDNIFRINDLKETFSIPYESRIYEGNFCNWQDIYQEWFFKLETYKKAIKKLDELLDNEKKISCFCLYGKMFSGKSCVLKALACYLEKNGFEILEYRGRVLRIKSLLKYIKISTSKKIVFVLDNAAFYYPMIESLFNNDIGEKKLVILTASREYYHSKKKYYLDGNNYIAYHVRDSFCEEDVTTILKTLDSKSHLSSLASLHEREQRKKIMKMKNIINLLLGLTYGNLADRIIQEYKKRFSSFNFYEKKLLTELAIFDIADIDYYPRVLFAETYGENVDIDENIEIDKMKICDYIRVDNRGLTLRNAVLDNFIIKEMKKNLIAILIDVLKRIGHRVSERKKDVWYIIFQCLLKNDVLHNKLKLSEKQREKLFFSVKEDYKKNSYYWLQLGLFFQERGDYTRAYNYLEMSASIRPNSYKIQHAIARNFLRHANHAANKTEAIELFKEGEIKMKALINSKEYYKEKAKPFSVSCYIIEKIYFCKNFQMSLDKRDIKYMYDELNSIANKFDSYLDSVCETFFAFLNETGQMHIITLQPDDYLMKFIGNSNILRQDILDDDPLIESI